MAISDLANPTRFIAFADRVLPFVFYILPLLIIFVIVVGSIFFKIAAPTEAAALGCLSALAVCYFFRLFKNKIRISGINCIRP